SGDGEVLLVKFDGAAGLAEVCVGEAEVAESGSFPSSPAELPRRLESGFEPADELRGPEPEVEAVDCGMRVPPGQVGTVLVAGSVVRRPGLARTDVGPLQINQPQAAEKSRAALNVEFVGLLQNVPVVL